jgi:hypothetical protein
MSNQDYWERTKYNPNLRRDAIHVAQSGGNFAAAFFWGFLGVCAVAFWPLGVHGTGGIVAKAAWWGFLGICAVLFAVRASRRSRR